MSIYSEIQGPSLICNSALIYSFINGRDEVSPEVSDLLENNIGVIQVATTDYTEESERTILKRVCPA